MPHNPILAFFYDEWAQVEGEFTCETCAHIVWAALYQERLKLIKWTCPACEKTNEADYE